MTKSRNPLYVNLALLLLFTSVSTVEAQTQVIAEFMFDGGSAASSDTSINSLTTDWDLSNSSPAAEFLVLPSGNGVTSVIANENATSAPGGIPGIGALPPIDPAASDAQWQQFSFTVQNLAAGETLTLDSFSYDYDVVEPFVFQSGVYSNLSGYTGRGDELGGVEPDDNVTGVTNTSFGLSGSEFSGLSNNDFVEFRVYLADDSSSNDRIHRLDNITLTGTVFATIPEPSSVAVLGLVGLAGFLRRRKIS